MEEQLIAEIERRPVLYDRSVQACKKMSARDEAWREVADIVKQSGSAIMLYYNIIMDCAYVVLFFYRGRSEETLEDAPGFVHEVPPVAAHVRAQGQEENVDLLQRDGVFDTAHRAQRVILYIIILRRRGASYILHFYYCNDNIISFL